ncbi:MAG: SprT-like domain-containing protein [Prevotella sp.]|nr:SprT-like domain-containing protein [Prevotella sp.]
MELTTEYLTEEFQRFNRDYFDGGLPLPRLALSRSRTRLGSFSCKRRLTWRGYRMTDFCIRISTYYDLSERQVQNVLLHEMIHYSIAYTGLKDTSAHGVVFRGMMDALNRKYGWEITVMQNTKGWQTRVPQKSRVRLILALKTRDGRCFLSVVNPKFSAQLQRQIVRVPDIVWHGWYESSDDFFAAFPSVRTLRGRRIARKTFEEKLSQLSPRAEK